MMHSVRQAVPSAPSVTHTLSAVTLPLNYCNSSELKMLLYLIKNHSNPTLLLYRRCPENNHIQLIFNAVEAKTGYQF